VVKCKIDDLRAFNFWRKVAMGRSPHTPVVVLTDRRHEGITLEPFAVGYRMFAERLTLADHWLIAGYSVGDVPVNRAFQRALRVRRSLGEPDPYVLVVGHGNSRAVKRLALRAGLTSTSLPASGLGIPKALGRQRWRDWAA
jgi:hypothetical protein